MIALVLLLDDQEVVVVGAEGIDKSGQGVLRISLGLSSSAGTIGLESAMDVASASFRAPVDALEMAGFSHRAKDSVVLLMNKDVHSCEEQSLIETMPRCIRLLPPQILSHQQSPNHKELSTINII